MTKVAFIRLKTLSRFYHSQISQTQKEPYFILI